MSDELNKNENVFTGRNFRLVFFGALVSELGAILYSFAVGFYLLEISENNAFLQGLYLAVCGVVFLIFTPVGGVLGDRLNKAKIMYVCDYVRGAGIVLATLCMLLLPSHAAHIVILFVIGILGNVIGGIFSPASAALLPHIVRENQLQQANAYFSIKSSLQGIFGIVLAGVLYAAVPIHALFIIVGVCYILSGVSEMFIRIEFHPSQEKLTLAVALSDMREGFVYLKKKKAVMALMSSVLFINFFFSPIGSNFIPYFIKTDVAGASSFLFDGFLTPELWSSVFNMMTGISSLAAAALLSARPQKDKCVHQVSLLLCVLSGLMAGMTAGYWLLVSRGVSLNVFLVLLSLACLVIGFVITCINIPVNTALLRVVDRDKLSKVTSILSIISQGLIPVSSVLAGLILQTAGSTPLLVICTAGFTGAALFLLFNRQAKEL